MSAPPGPITVSTVTLSSTPQATTTTTQSVQSTPSSTSDAGTIAGCVVGGVVFLVLVVLAALLFLRARKRKRTPPSSEFINSIREGARPVLRLDSGAEYSPGLAEKTHYPPTGTQNTYHTTSPMLDMKFPVEMIDTPSRRPSVEKPLHPQRYSAQHQPSTSVGSRRELLSDTGRVSCDFSPVRRFTDSVPHFAPLDNPSQEPSQLSHSPPSLHPLRRQPESEDT